MRLACPVFKSRAKLALDTSWFHFTSVFHPVYHNQENSMLTALHLIFMILLEAWKSTHMLLA